ncbi:MAG: ATP-dependent helicase Lhr and Lhr-like helicase, partial [Thermoanaerobaculia bacterium]|nr:ATP-dependent helicase Lhr and Lhr-like helicase [Thermoanaerobaculia bacterium]
LDANAIERVREEARPDPRDADELHDALLTFGFLVDGEVEASELFTELAAARRATLVLDAAWIAAERIPELLAIHSTIQVDIAPPPSRMKDWPREDAIVEIIRGRMSLLGPTTAAELGQSMNVDEKDADAALLKLESEGAILRGSFTPTPHSPHPTPQQWCDRRLLARIHRYTLNRLRAEIEPVNAADFMRFLFAWQHVTPPHRLTGSDGLHEVIRQLDGFEIAANTWERHVLPLRIDRYEPALLDTLCFTGEVGWARLTTGVALFPRTHMSAWLTETTPALTERAQHVLDTLRSRGASFARDLGDDTEALDELVTAGLITSDGFIGRRPERAGRWSLITSDVDREEAVETQARALLKRYGVIFRRLLTREPNAAPWRELARVYRRLEARGEIRGGRFVTGMSGEQFALPEAVTHLREIRRTPADGRLTVISACDPLNLIGILTTTDRIRAIAGTRIAYRDGIAVAVMEGDFLRPFDQPDIEAAAALAGRRVPVAAGFVGRTA